MESTSLLKQHAENKNKERAVFLIETSLEDLNYEIELNPCVTQVTKERLRQIQYNIEKAKKLIES